MDKEEQERVRAVLEEILAVADMDNVTVRQVRNMAAEKTGIDLSATREWKSFVSNVVTNFFESRNYTLDAEAKDSRDRSSKKMKRTEDTEAPEEMEGTKENEDVNDQEDEDDEEEARGEGERPKYQTDEEGNHIICELSAKRKVVVSQWKGKTLISVREYYEKDGKIMPSSKGISLTAEQFEVLAKSANDIDTAISSLQ